MRKEHYGNLLDFRKLDIFLQNIFFKESYYESQEDKAALEWMHDGSENPARCGYGWSLLKWQGAPTRCCAFGAGWHWYWSEFQKYRTMTTLRNLSRAASTTFCSEQGQAWGWVRLLRAVGLQSSRWQSEMYPGDPQLAGATGTAKQLEMSQKTSRMMGGLWE